MMGKWFENFGRGGAREKSTGRGGAKKRVNQLICDWGKNLSDKIGSQTFSPPHGAGRGVHPCWTGRYLQLKCHGRWLCRMSGNEKPLFQMYCFKMRRLKLVWIGTSREGLLASFCCLFVSWGLRRRIMAQYITRCSNCCTLNLHVT